jgi:hypothetical protein
LPGDDFSHKPKHVASSKSDKISAVIDNVCFLPAVHVSQQNVNDKDINAFN